MKTLPPLEHIEEAAQLIATAMRPTPEICWATLSKRCRAEVWVKHENHTPIGAFKIRGGLVYIHNLMRGKQAPAGIIAATRGNHGQSIAYAALRLGLQTTIVVPHGNSEEKNLAMRMLGANLAIHGHDFQAALEYATSRAAERGLAMVPSFHDLLVRGVATCGLEFLRTVPDLGTVYVPIGLGSGICGMIAAREALGAGTKVVGVVAENAPAYALSFNAGKPISTDSATTVADGVACRVPDPRAVEIINRYAERIVQVSEAEIRAAMRHYFTDTHNVAEGAGAAPLAALLKEPEAIRGRRVGLVLTGGNVDRSIFADILSADES
jgi:threonine dehydratase